MLYGSRSDSVGGAPPGVQLRKSSYTSGADTLRVNLPATPEQEKRFYDFLAAQQGKPYDGTAIVAFIVDRDWQENDMWFCSELIAAALCDCQWFTYKLAVKANKIDPGDLLLVISAVTPIALP